MTRYADQISLNGWGREAQERLKSSKVLIAGAGGLASATALYLLAAGIGVIQLVDGTRVDLADLNQHLLLRERDLGKAKATVVADRLQKSNSFAEVESHVKELSEHNVFRLTAGCNVLIDASNNTQVGSLLNLVAVREKIPLVSSWIGEMKGYLTTFWPGHGPCFSCAFLEPHSRRPALLGPLPGVMGSLQALEVLRILGWIGPALLGRVLIFEENRFKFTEKSLPLNEQCMVCSSEVS